MGLETALKNTEKDILQEKCMDFSVKIVNLYQSLCNDRHEFVMSKQMLKCGTSIGANVREAKRAQSKPDFLSKLSIALKEADETQYWLELMSKTGYINENDFKGLFSDSEELVKILVSITKTIKSQIKTSRNSNS
ncbi:MAG: four helix bundle protein [Fibrobacter sp.]|nr:four helix bundle protein [Fibrobacter sp.]